MNRVRSLVGMRRDAGGSKLNLLDKAPAGWLDVREVAALKGGIKVRSARVWLTRKGIKRVFVKAAPSGFKCYWDDNAVRRELEDYEVVENIPVGWCCYAEACMILGCARSSLYRFADSGLLEERRVRVRKDTGSRYIVLYKRAQVRGLKRARYASECARQRLRERRLRRSLGWLGAGGVLQRE